MTESSLIPEKRRKVKQISQLEHAKQKSMWTGSKTMQTIEMYLLIEDTFRLKKIMFASKEETRFFLAAVEKKPCIFMSMAVLLK